MPVTGKYTCGEYQTFEEWFESSGISEDHKDVAIQAWNAATDISSDYFGDHEGTDYGLSERLKADDEYLKPLIVKA